MTRQGIEELAKARGQCAVLCRVCNRDVWLLVDNRRCSLDKLAESLSTDSWELWSEGRLQVYDGRSRLIVDKARRRDWAKLQPIEFRQE